MRWVLSTKHTPLPALLITPTHQTPPVTPTPSLLATLTTTLGQTFVTHWSNFVASQMVALLSLAIYFDCDQPLLSPPKKWNLLECREWDALLLPGAHEASDAHQYLLCPVDGTMRYVRRGPKARTQDSDAAQEADFQLCAISVCLHHMQYVSAQKMLVAFDEYQASAPHRHLRPAVRPTAPGGARLWWRYAGRVVSRQQQRQSMQWRQVKVAAQLRRQYVPAYVRCLQQGKVGGDDVTAKMETDIDEHVILWFRWAAHQCVCV